jgi:hypothetical protein
MKICRRSGLWLWWWVFYFGGYWVLSSLQYKIEISILRHSSIIIFFSERKITGQQLKDFLMISSPALATRIVYSVFVEFRGKRKGGVNTLSFKQK